MISEQLNRRVIIQQDIGATRNSIGEHVEDWVDVATVWAGKKNQASREYFAASKINAELTDLFIIRYRSDIDSKMRLVFDGKNYNIIGAPDPDGSRRELQLITKVVD